LTTLNRKLRKRLSSRFLNKLIEYQVGNPKNLKKARSPFASLLTFDTEQLPADLLAPLYHQRGRPATIDEVKTHLHGCKDSHIVLCTHEVLQELSAAGFFGTLGRQMFDVQAATMAGSPFAPQLHSFIKSYSSCYSQLSISSTGIRVFFRELFREEV